MASPGSSYYLSLVVDSDDRLRDNGHDSSSDKQTDRYTAPTHYSTKTDINVSSHLIHRCSVTDSSTLKHLCASWKDKVSPTQLIRASNGRVL